MSIHPAPASSAVEGLAVVAELVLTLSNLPTLPGLVRRPEVHAAFGSRKALSAVKSVLRLQDRRSEGVSETEEKAAVRSCFPEEAFQASKENDPPYWLG